MFGRTRCVLWVTGYILVALLMAVELGFGEKTGGSDDDAGKSPSDNQHGKDVFKSSKCPEDDSECKELCSAKDKGVGSCEDDGQNCKCVKIQGRFWHGKEYKPSAPRDCYMCG